MMTRLSASLAALFWMAAASAAEWHVAPAGTASAAGTRESPWDLASALNGKQQKVAPGDTVRLAAGRYKQRPEMFAVRLAGTAEKPICVRPEPGARATVDGGVDVQAPSAHVVVRDIEILTSERQPNQWGLFPQMGAQLHGGRDCKYVGILTHDNVEGIEAWLGEVNCEIYGCLIYDNGYNDKDRPHGHGIYTQNKEGVKTISNNIISAGWSNGTLCIQLFGTKAPVENYVVEDNVCWDKGPVLYGGMPPSKNILARRNYLYNVDLWAGYNWTTGESEGCEVSDHWIVNGDVLWKMQSKTKKTGNTVIKKGAARPTEPKVVLLPSKYDPDRAHLAVYNFGKTETVEVSFAPFLKPGESFRLMHPRDFFGKPLYTGKVGADGKASAPVAGEFGVFVVVKEPAAPAAEPAAASR